jgi:hypothetical protein
MKNIREYIIWPIILIIAMIVTYNLVPRIKSVEHYRVNDDIVVCEQAGGELSVTRWGKYEIRCYVPSHDLFKYEIDPTPTP